MIIKITEDSIIVDASFMVPLRQKQVEKPIVAKTVNDINLPLMQTHFDLAAA